MIAKGLIADPIPHCHIVTTTTHKTLRGPRGGLILMGKDFQNPFGITLKNGKKRMMSSLLDSAVFSWKSRRVLWNILLPQKQLLLEKR